MPGHKIWVSPDGDKWKVHWQGGGVIAYCSTQTEGISKARQTVRAYPKGEVHQVFVQRPNGEIRTEWTYGVDPFPPPG